MDQKMELFNQLADLLVSTNSRREMKGLLRGILTHKELHEIPMRLEIFRLLKMNIPHQEIAKKLGVGVATVTRGSMEMKRGNFKFLSWRPARSGVEISPK